MESLVFNGHSNMNGGPPQNGLGGGGGVPGPSSGIVGMSVQPPVSTPSQIQQQSGVEGTSGLIGNAMKPMLGIEAVSFPEFSEFGTTDWQSPMLSGGYSSSPSPTMTGGSGSMRMGGGPMHGGEDESNRKRQVRLLKNREAAKECRRKKKVSWRMTEETLNSISSFQEYVKCLENRVSVLENQNKALIEELKTLKELYCRKEKDGM
uniref:BZIP domain-containing protein n=1 Tax=Caenorhabditis tropicalis TaxID=1561998 RepID=A0A1I7T383_9PELO